jgi:hypothetical protein
MLAVVSASVAALVFGAGGSLLQAVTTSIEIRAAMMRLAGFFLMVDNPDFEWRR